MQHEADPRGQRARIVAEAIQRSSPVMNGRATHAH
jgi:hypothetical protein